MRSSDWLPEDEGDFDQEFFQQSAEELDRIPNAVPDESGAIECAAIPLRDAIVFPRMIAPLPPIGRLGTFRAVEQAQVENRTVIGLIQRDPAVDKPGVDDFLSVAVEMAVGPLTLLPGGEEGILVHGRRRVRVERVYQAEGSLYARGRVVEESMAMNDRLEAQMERVLRLFERYVELTPSIPDETYEYIMNLDERVWLADLVGASIPTSLQEKHALITELDPARRLKLVNSILKHQVARLEVDEEIHSKVQDEMEKGERESYLREQMKAIQTELGETDPWNKEIDELHDRVQAAELPEEVKAAAHKEIKRLRQMPPMSPEVGVIRTYVDWILDLPWAEETKDNLDVNHAAEVLERNHFGLQKAKDRILEYIAVRNLKPKHPRQPILCFVGPPGTGKTSLGSSIAEALGRKFVRLSLGGVRDEAEIRGHRRTYIGALPGRILQTMRRAGSVNPLFMLDEVDKLSSDVRGDPASALLEVLDPEQNFAFSDHYLELAYDLSKVMFITTANTRATIPWALLDRMEVIDFPGYIEEEKIEIARRFLIGRQMEESGLEEGELQFSDDALKRIIREYTYEAGVRNLEREIGRICRKVARLKAEGKRFRSRIGPATVEKFLGPPEFMETQAEGKDEVGVATAIAWTETGGDIMPVEVLLMEGKGNLQITGNIGDIMEESGQAALSYLKSHAKEFGVKLDSFENTDVHVHIPEGSVPKDGPSAGVTIATAIISAFTGRKVRREVGMTGEVTLRGRVLPVGGVREKVLAAHRAGLKTVILPKRNQKDLVEVPKKALADLEIVPAADMADVLRVALMPKETPAKPVSRSKPRERTASTGKDVSAPAAGA